MAYYAIQIGRFEGITQSAKLYSQSVVGYKRGDGKRFTKLADAVRYFGDLKMLDENGHVVLITDKYFAVKVGKRSGIYGSQMEAVENIGDFKDAIWDIFDTPEEARVYMTKSLDEVVTKVAKKKSKKKKKKTKSKFFAVVRGHQPGVYEGYESFLKQITGFPNPHGKGFKTREEALAYLNQHGVMIGSGRKVSDLTAKEAKTADIYVVKRGYHPGLYLDVLDYQMQMKGFPNPVGKKIKGFKAAQKWFDAPMDTPAPQKKKAWQSLLSIFGKIREIKPQIKLPQGKVYKHDFAYETEEQLEVPFAYVDGSFNTKTHTYGYGLLFSVDGLVIKEYHGSDKDPELVDLHNVAGEYLGAIRALMVAMEMGLSELHLYHDFDGIGHVANGISKAGNPAAKRFKNLYEFASTKMTITFHKVKSHSGNTYNNRADKLAKYAVGLINKI